MVDTHTHTCARRRARARTYKPFLPLGEEGDEGGPRAPFLSSSSFFSFSRRAYPSYRLTAVSHYGSIWSAFRNLVISFDRYNLNPAIAKQTLKDPPRALALPAQPSLRIQAASWFAKLDNSINPTEWLCVGFIRCDIYTPISIYFCPGRYGVIKITHTSVLRRIFLSR